MTAGGIFDHAFRRSLTILVVLAAALALIVPAWSAPAKKQYGVSLVPASAQGGQSTPVQIRLTNLTASQVAGSANITFPAAFAGFGSAVFDGVYDSSGNLTSKTWSVETSGNTVRLRNPGPSSTNALTLNQSVRVTVNVTTPCAPATYTVPVDVKQSNDFNGVGNDLAGPDGTFTVTSGCAHHLAFTVNPPATGTSAGQPMSTVTVAVQDAANNLVDVDGLAVTLCISNGSGGCSNQTLYGTTTRNTTHGTVSFGGLIIAQEVADQTYRLLATAASNPPSPALSDAFTVAGVAVACFNEGSQCNGNFGDPEDATRGQISGSVSSLTGSNCANCFLTIQSSDVNPSDCPDTTGGCKVDVTFLYIPPSNVTGLVSVALTCDKKDCPGTGVANFNLYFEDSEGVHLLEPCDKQSPDAPCIASRSRTGVGDLQWIILANPTDPRGWV